MSEADERRRRAERRRLEMVLHKTELVRVEKDLHPIRGSEAVRLAVHLSLQSWLISGRPLPTYTRAEIPVRFDADRRG